MPTYVNVSKPSATSYTKTLSPHFYSRYGTAKYGNARYGGGNIVWTNVSKPSSYISFLIDSYSESKYDSDTDFNTNSYHGQSFSCSTDTKLGSCKFYLSKYFSSMPTGNAYAKLYAHTGTYGTNGKPTGSALATSDAIDVSTLTSSYQLVTFYFTGNNQIDLTAGTKYVIVIYFLETDGVLQQGCDAFSSTHSGNYSYSIDGSSWSTLSSVDLIFYVYGLTSFYTNINKPT